MIGDEIPFPLRVGLLVVRVLWLAVALVVSAQGFPTVALGLVIAYTVVLEYGLVLCIGGVWEALEASDEADEAAP